MSASLPPLNSRHGGNRYERAVALGCRSEDLLDLSASLVPFGPPAWLPKALRRSIAADIRNYPDRSYSQLRTQIAEYHNLDNSWVMPGNGAAELFTWIARHAAQFINILPQPGFADYSRALNCWNAQITHLPLKLDWQDSFPQDLNSAFSEAIPFGEQYAIWITNPHNPTGQLWSRESLEHLLTQFALVVVDEAFLPLILNGEKSSVIPLLLTHPNLIVVRSLTKLYSVPGLRLGYVLAAPSLLHEWQSWRDPWPVNAIAASLTGPLLADKSWQQRVQDWVAREGIWLSHRLRCFRGLMPKPSAANFLLVKGIKEMESIRYQLEVRHKILVRTAVSFDGLGDRWLRFGLSDRAGNKKLIKALASEMK